MRRAETFNNLLMLYVAGFVGGLVASSPHADGLERVSVLTDGWLVSSACLCVTVTTATAAPAASAAWMPAGASSNTRQSSIRCPRRSAASRKQSGAGLPRVDVLGGHQHGRRGQPGGGEPAQRQDGAARR